MTIVEFLRQRLDEDEAAAKLVNQPYRLYVSDDGRIAEPQMHEDPYSANQGEYRQDVDGYDIMPSNKVSWALIYDPARVLREVEAKRAMVDTCDRQRTDPNLRPMAAIMLKLLALPYADHPDYDLSWMFSLGTNG